MEQVGNESNVVRTHDDFYVHIDPDAPPKDTFVQVGNLIDCYLEVNTGVASIIDIGCATGAFLNYLGNRFPRHEIRGYEYLDKLVVSGKEKYPNIKISSASILDIDAIACASVDVITVLGVISIFDDIEPIVKNLASWIKPGGKLLIHGMFNPFDVDVFVKYRNSDEHGVGPYQAGWNVISQKTITELLLKLGSKKVQFHDFRISVDLVQDTKDPLRSWTEKLEDGSRQIINATCLKQPQYICEVDF